MAGIVSVRWAAAGGAKGAQPCTACRRTPGAVTLRARRSGPGAGGAGAGFGGCRPRLAAGRGESAPGPAAGGPATPALRPRRTSPVRAPWGEARRAARAVAFGGGASSAAYPAAGVYASAPLCLVVSLLARLWLRLCKAGDVRASVTCQLSCDARAQAEMRVHGPAEDVTVSAAACSGRVVVRLLMRLCRAPDGGFHERCVGRPAELDQRAGGNRRPIPRGRRSGPGSRRSLPGPANPADVVFSRGRSRVGPSVRAAGAACPQEGAASDSRVELGCRVCAEPGSGGGTGSRSAAWNAYAASRACEGARRSRRLHRVRAGQGLRRPSVRRCTPLALPTCAFSADARSRGACTRTATHTAHPPTSPFMPRSSPPGLPVRCFRCGPPEPSSGGRARFPCGGSWRSGEHGA